MKSVRILLLLTFDLLISKLNGQCPVCFEDGAGFDSTLLPTGPIGPFSGCANNQNSMMHLSQDSSFCAQLQIENYFSCGCETVPPGVCLTDNDGLPLETDGGKLVAADFTCDAFGYFVAMAHVFDAVEEETQDSCDFYQSFCYVDYEPSCPICADGGTGFDPTKELFDTPFGDDFSAQFPTCSSIEDILPFLGFSDEIDCDFFQAVTGLYCGCSTTPDGFNACNKGPDGAYFPDMNKIPSLNHFLYQNEESTTCGALSILAAWEGDSAEDELSFCDIVVGLCAEGPTCDICPNGLGDPNIIVDEESGLTCGEAMEDLVDFVMSEDTCAVFQEEAKNSNCCHLDFIDPPNITPVDGNIYPSVSPEDDDDDDDDMSTKKGKKKGLDKSLNLTKKRGGRHLYVIEHD